VQCRVQQRPGRRSHHDAFLARDLDTGTIGIFVSDGNQVVQQIPVENLREVFVRQTGDTFKAG
jgi:hypothetical protein